MRQFLSVMNSDSINRYGWRFSVGALVSALEDEHLLGTPLTVAHDASRLIGWSHPLAVYMEPGLARLIGLMEMAEDDEEYQKLVRYYAHHLRERHAEANLPEFEHLRTLLSAHLSDEYQPIHSECVAIAEPGLARRVFRRLFREQDADGLISMDLLNPIGPGVFQIGELAAFAHYYMRRNLFRLNTLNYPLLQEVQRLAGSSASARIALDPDMVGLASTYSGGTQELAYWWGPKFDDDLTSIPPGVTHHEADEVDRVCYGISGTEFRWSLGDGQRTFEAEELRDVPSAPRSTLVYGCRYLHSIVSRAGQVSHIDGSIRAYSEEDMLNRIGLDLKHAGKDTKYTKLWRLDGIIDVPTWKRLVSDHFRDNYLVGEYLGAEDPFLAEMHAKGEAMPRSLGEEYAPYSIHEGMGVRVALSYHPRSDEGGTEPLVVSLDRVSSGISGTVSIVDSSALELKKAMTRLGVALKLPAEVKLVSFKDFYVSLPLVSHSSSCLPERLSSTIDAIRMLVQAWRERGQNWVVSYTIGFPVSADREARISVLGQVTDLEDWLSSPLAYPPTSAEALRDWAERSAQCLRENYSAELDSPRVLEVLMPTGILLINRKLLDWGGFQVRYSDELRGHVFELPVPDDKKSLSEELQASGISPTPAFLILESSCTKCGQDYRDCDCSKLLDEDVAQRITKCVPFLFWTDSPLW